jgi:hypothetical protein
VCAHDAGAAHRDLPDSCAAAGSQPAGKQQSRLEADLIAESVVLIFEWNEISSLPAGAFSGALHPADIPIAVELVTVLRKYSNGL